MMRKAIKEVLTSKLFVLTFVLSVFAILLHFIVYSAHAEANHQYYVIENFQEISEYDEEIQRLTESLKELNPKDEEYELSKTYAEEEIRIYEEMKINPVNYDHVYDFGSLKADEAISYILGSDLWLKGVLFFNVLVLLYLIFTREFDNDAYSFLYATDRKKVLLPKMASFALLLLGYFALYVGLIFLFSLPFQHELTHVLIVDSKRAYFLPIAAFLWKEYIFQNFYVLCFYCLTMWSIVFLGNRTLRSLLIFLAVASIYIALGYLGTNLDIYLGIRVDPAILNYDLTGLGKLGILLPLGAFIGSYFFFQKKDLA